MANHSPRVCVVGSTNVDLTFRTTRLPRTGETLTGQGFQLGFGGKGANQAVMAARLGAQVRMVSKVGGDVFGQGALRNYQEQGVDTEYVGTDDTSPTGVAGIVVDDEARNCIVVVPGANASLSPDDVRAAMPAIADADVLLCQLEVPIETTCEALRLAHAAGVKTILNPAPALPLSDEIFALADIAIPNETEIELLTDRAVTTLTEAESAARSLRDRGPRTVIVTLGSRGALIVDAAGAEHVAGIAVPALDPTGAGDAFIGSLAVFLARRFSLRDAVRRANAVAALTVTRHGAQTALPTAAEASKFLSSLAFSPEP